MSPADVRAYFERTVVPVRLACRTPAGRLWLVSLWYRYQDGRLLCATGADATLVEYLEADDEVAFEVSVNTPPYTGVRGVGTATIAPDEDKAVLRSLFDRYLGGTDSPLADDLPAPERAEVRVEIEPDRLHSWDFTARMAGSD